MSGSSSQYSSRSLDETSALLPTETKAENPRPSLTRLFEQGEPERAALRRKADRARGSARGPNVAFRLGQRRRFPDSWGRRAFAFGAYELQEVILALSTSATSAKPAGDDSAFVPPGASSTRGGISLRKANDHQIRRFSRRSLTDVYPRTSATDRRPGLHGVDDAPLKSASTMLRKSRPPMESRRGGAEDGNIPVGAKNGRSGWPAAEVVPSIDAVEICGGRRDREADLELGAFQPSRDLETRLFEYLQHRPVLSEDVGDEPLDAGFGRPSRQDAPAASGRSPALVLVGDLDATSAALVSRSRMKPAWATGSPSSSPISEPHSIQSGSRNGSTSFGPTDGGQ